MPELFTLVVALTDQSVDEFGSTGSTVFALGSHLPVDVARKLYTRGYDIVSPTLKKGIFCIETCTLLFEEMPQFLPEICFTMGAPSKTDKSQTIAYYFTQVTIYFCK